MNKVLYGFAVAVVMTMSAQAATAGEVEGKVVAVNASGQRITVKVDDRDVVFLCSAKTRFVDPRGRDLKTGLDSSLFKEGAVVRILTESGVKKDCTRAASVRVLR